MDECKIQAPESDVRERQRVADALYGVSFSLDDQHKPVRFCPHCGRRIVR